MKSRSSSSSSSSSSRSSSSNPPSSLHYSGSRPPQAQAHAQAQLHFQSQSIGVAFSEATSNRRRRRTTTTQQQHQRLHQQQQFVPTLDTIPSNKATSGSSGATTNRSTKTKTTTTITNRQQQQQQLLSKQQPQKKSKPLKPPKTTKKEKGKTTTTKKRYRRVKRLKPCVPKAIFLIPLVILAMERYIGQVIHLDDATTAVYDQVGIDPFAILTNEVDYDYNTKTSITVTTAVTQRQNIFPSLMNITHTPRFKCHNREQKRILNIHNPYSHSRFIDSNVNNQTIPKIIHQHGPTRCLTITLDRAAVQWAGGSDRWSYYYWDDDAVERLMNLVVSSDRNVLHVPEFPLLKAATMTSKCYDDGNHNRSNSSEDDVVALSSVASPKLIEQLWQYLILWLYGGMYVDLSYRPTGFNATTMIHDSDHGIFVFADNNDPNIITPQNTTSSAIPPHRPGQQEQELPLSSKFMAVTPKHPLIYLTIHHMIRKILLVGSSRSSGRPPSKSKESNGEMTSLPQPANKMAQIALNEAWDDYKKGGGKSRIKIQPSKQLRQHRLDDERQRLEQKKTNDDEDIAVRTVGTIGRYRNELVSSVFQTEREQKEEYDKLFEQKKKLQQQQQQQRDGLNGAEAGAASTTTTTTTTLKSFGDGDDCHLLGLSHGY